MSNKFKIGDVVEFTSYEKTLGKQEPEIWNTLLSKRYFIISSEKINKTFAFDDGELPLPLESCPVLAHPDDLNLVLIGKQNH